MSRFLKAQQSLTTKVRSALSYHFMASRHFARMLIGDGLVRVLLGQSIGKSSEDRNVRDDALGLHVVRVLVCLSRLDLRMS